eukprot:CAMPEP_0172776356 /NCGR_PEP_ID=MMETSP1074-20121228/199694_1 /TAXON_ID=2916 /ORGANISM="Ceratium fusus, Strain PA161109" /LENGTH=89 /DNA_ID=CAMNT_0013613117 /DNA_START=155 /DNA_END=424 /DNA_ORIENTATION=+
MALELVCESQQCAAALHQLIDDHAMLSSRGALLDLHYSVTRARDAHCVTNDLVKVAVIVNDVLVCRINGDDDLLVWVILPLTAQGILEE